MRSLALRGDSVTRAASWSAVVLYRFHLGARAVCVRTMPQKGLAGGQGDALFTGNCTGHEMKSGAEMVRKWCGFQCRIRRGSPRLGASAVDQAAPCGNQNWSVSGPVQGGGIGALKCRNRLYWRACTAVPGGGTNLAPGREPHRFCTGRKINGGAEMVRKRCSFHCRTRRTSLRLCASAVDRTARCRNQNWPVSGPVPGGQFSVL